MKLLLLQTFNSLEPRTPIALLDLAAYGRQHGHTIEVRYAQDYLDNPAGGYDALGLSAVSYTSNLLDTLQQLRPLADRLLFGGKGSAALEKHDEEKILELGVEIVKGPGEALFSDSVDYQNYPAWSVNDFAALDRAGISEVMSSRGCPYSCAFCHNTEPKMRYFAAGRTAEHCRIILNAVGRGSVFIVDDLFAFRVSHMMAVLDAANKIGLDLRGRNTFFAHISQIDSERLKAIKSFQPTEVQIGIESGDNRMLKEMGKTFTSEEAAENLRALYTAGIRVICLFMLGFPGESRESLQTTIGFIRRNRKYMVGCCAGYYQPVPYTEGWRKAVERVGRSFSTGGWNREIAYLDPNLTVGDLTTAQRTIRDDLN
jgi:hypothetical protein